MTQSRSVLALSLVALTFLLWAYWPVRASATGPFETGKVRLYSNGQVVGEWEAAGSGRVDGDTFVFPVHDGVQELEVRIRGTFSFEAQP
jgi:hypothetical protein